MSSTFEIDPSEDDLGRVDPSLGALGAVLDAERGHLPFALIHGEPLVACAAWALGAAGILTVDVATPWSALAEADGPLVLHDPLCPMTPPAFLAACTAHAVARSVVSVGVRPVTDTVKELEGPYVGATVDRTALLQVVAPVVLTAAVVADLDGLVTTDLAALVAHLATRFPVETLAAPAEARRVASVDDLRLLEALTAPVR